MIDFLPSELPLRENVNGVAVEMLSVGKGRPLLYLHAGDGLNPSAPFLVELAKTFRVIAVSHPGFGESSIPAEYRSVADLAFFYLDLIEHLKLDDVVLVGASFGAWVAAELATMSTAKLSCLVLAGAVGAKFGSREIREITDVFSIETRELRSFLRHDGRPDDADYSKVDVGTVSRIVRNREMLARFGWSPTLHNPQLRQRLHRINVPSLLLWGASDRIVSVDYGRAFAAEIPGAKLQVVPDAGHFVHADRPAEFARHIADFAKAA